MATMKASKRTRSGCAACKASHKKCDERRPFCRNCEKRRIKCPGFQQELKWRDHEAQLQSQPKRGTRRSSQQQKHDAATMLLPEIKLSHQAHARLRPESVLKLVLEEPESGRESRPGAERDRWSSLFHTETTPFPDNDLLASFWAGANSSLPLSRTPSTVPIDEVLTSPVHQDRALDDPACLDALEFPFIDVNETAAADPFMEEIDHNLFSKTFDLESCGPQARFRTSTEWTVPPSTQSPPYGTQNEAMSPSGTRQKSIPFHFFVIPRELPFLPSILLQYYFDHVCAHICLYDGNRNPFRALVLGRWDSSALLYSTIQYLAAAYLGKQAPQMRVVAETTKAEALTALESSLRPQIFLNLRRDNDTLLAVLLLCISVSWHDGDDMGLKFYDIAVAIMRLRSQAKNNGSSHIDVFFQQALTYWWMILTFVCQPKHAVLPPPDYAKDYESPYYPDSHRDKIFPHPWSGISIDAQDLLGRVAAYSQSGSRGSGSQHDILDGFVHESVGRSFLDEALRLKLHARSDVAEPDDSEINLDAFVNYNTAYQQAIVILIYRVFPGLLCKDTAQCKTAAVLSDRTHSCPLCPSYNVTGGRTSDGLETHALFPLALNVLELIGQTKSHMQSIGGPTIHLLTIAAGELYLPTIVGQMATDMEDPMNLPCCLFRSASASLAQVRRFVLEVCKRLEDYFHFIHLYRLRKVILEVWRLADEGQPALWMDVMNEKDWKVLIG